MAEPLPLCYLNGEYLPLQRGAHLPARPRLPVRRRRLRGDAGVRRPPVPLRRAPGAPRRAASPASAWRIRTRASEWRAILGTLIERNGGGDQYVYWQVTRGAEFGRNHAPLPKIPRTVFAFCAPLPATAAGGAAKRASPASPPRTRAGRAATSSRSRCSRTCCCGSWRSTRSAGETILLRDGELTEASASAVHVVLGGEVLMPPNSRRILPGTTRCGGGGDGGARRRDLPRRCRSARRSCAAPRRSGSRPPRAKCSR